MNSGVWQPPPRPEGARRQYAEAEAAMAADPTPFSLDRDALEHRAQTELPEGLARMALAAAQEGRLNALGRRTIGAMITALAKGGQRQRAHLDAQPEIARRPMARPIFIIGGWRTGTTLLHRMLAQVKGLRAPLYWQLSNPFGANEADPARRAQLIARAQAMHDFQYSLNPTKQIVHGSSAEAPEECVVAMGKDGLNWGLTATAWMPGYGAWLRQQDFTGAYGRHREILQIIQGTDDTGRWLLKAPAHTAELAALLRIYPDAQIIHLHRDIVETVASGASLFAVFHSTYSDAVDPVAIGAYQRETFALWCERALAARRAAPAAANFVDIQYSDLMADPLATARRILAAVDHPCAEDDVQAMAAYLEQNRQHGLGRHEYGPAQFGLDPDQVREHFAGIKQ
ncbi:MAG: sulfotransferase [Alphaproteobacteria bacterium]|jgi:hypothetical protein|nr:sulfotransferase [Alphaproteobacteria bacterium]MDP6831182.1 sulfotransferase [Alphaproteobacteria bacterium]